MFRDWEGFEGEMGFRMKGECGPRGQYLTGWGNVVRWEPKGRGLGGNTQAIGNEPEAEPESCWERAGEAVRRASHRHPAGAAGARPQTDRRPAKAEFSEEFRDRTVITSISNSQLRWT